MKRLLYAIPLLATPLLFMLQRGEKPVKSEQPESSLDETLPAHLETATFALG